MTGPQGILNRCKAALASARWSHWSPRRLAVEGFRAGPAVAAALANLVLPPRCAWCEADLPEVKEGVMLCHACQTHISGPVTPRCRRCAAPLAVADGSCATCRGRSFHFDATVALGAYAGALRESVLRLKRPGHEALATALAAFLAIRQRTALVETDADAAFPVPMNWMRRLSRRANSAELLAEVLARQLGLPYVHRPLRRIRNTRKQGPMLRTERLRNVRGAFRLASGMDVRDRRLILVDDVLTTGATCDEIAKVLKRAGAATVTVAVLARSDSA